MAYPTPYSAPPAPVVQTDQHTVQELSSPIYQARGWLKFLGVLSIISGVGAALSIAGIIFAWLPIWMGILMFQAGSSIDSAGQFGDRFAFPFNRIVCVRAKGRREENQSRQKYGWRPPAPVSRPRALRTVREQPLKPKWQKRHERIQPARAPVTTA